MIEHAERNKMSSFYKRYQESNNPYVTLSDFKFIGSNFRNHKCKERFLIYC